MKSAAILTVLLTVAPLTFAGEVKFTTKPGATKAGDKVKISFAVSEKTDVEVAVLNAKGEVVRHLAGGVLGGAKPPPKPLEAGLSQTLKWDMRDDFGKPAVGGPFKVRVRAGTGFKFGRLIGEDPYNFGAVDSIAADEQGKVYMMGYGGEANQGQMTLRAFDANGRYLRTLLPFPADLKPGETKDVARWDAARKTFRPRQLKNLNPDFYSGNRHGCLHVFAASAKKGVLLTDGGRVYRVGPRGEIPGDKFVIQSLWTRKEYVKNSGGGPNFLAASPDGKWLYLSGPYSNTNRYGYKFRPSNPPGRVYRVGVGQPGPMKEFVTVKVAHKNGNGGQWTKNAACMAHFTVAKGPVHGLAVDAKGRVYVSDREHSRVAVFDENGKEQASIPLKNPHLVKVHPKTGAVYAIQYDCVAYGRFQCNLYKFKNLNAKAPMAEHKFPVGKGVNRNPALTLAAGKDKTVLWIAGVQGGLVALEDKGASFAPAETGFKPKAGVQRDWNRLAVDYARDELYCSNGTTRMWRYDGETGKGGVLRKKGKDFLANDLAVGYDGNLYVRVSGSWNGSAAGYSGPFWRLDRNLDPAPYGGTGTHVLSPYIYSRYGIGFAERGIGVGPDGKAYLSFMYKWVAYAIGGFGPDGKPLPGNFLKGKFPATGKNLAKYAKGWATAIIGPVPQANSGIRVDLAGNIYVGCLYWPKGEKLPHGYKMDRMWTDTVGCVLKFDPGKGGAMTGKDGQQRATAFTGVLNTYTGLAPFSKAGIGGNTCCVCRGPRFDVDRYGRLALPNAVTCSVLVYDNAGNLIAEVGRYGNFDSQFVPAGSTDPKPLVSVPDIPLTWASGAGWSEKHLYINDTYSRRAVRTDLTYAVEAICPAAGGAASISRPKSTSSVQSSTTPQAAGPSKAPTAKKPVASRPGRSPKQVCTGWLSAARNYQRIGMKTDARRCLKNIIKTYPSTEWAVRARAELARL